MATGKTVTLEDGRIGNQRTDYIANQVVKILELMLSSYRLEVLFKSHRWCHDVIFESKTAIDRHRMFLDMNQHQMTSREIEKKVAATIADDGAAHILNQMTKMPEYAPVGVNVLLASYDADVSSDRLLGRMLYKFILD